MAPPAAAAPDCVAERPRYILEDRVIALGPIRAWNSGEDLIVKSIELKTRVGQDGILRLEIPLETREAELEVLVVVQPLGGAVRDEAADHDDWPSYFLEEIAGGWQGGTLVRPEQGEYEIRDELR